MPKQKIRTVFWSNQSLKNCPYFCYDLFEKEIRSFLYTLKSKGN